MKLYDGGPGSTNLGMGDLSIGISANGMVKYKEELKTELLVKCKEKLEDTDPVIKEINGAWQGKSRDTFLNDFRQIINQISNDLEKEYSSLEQRIDEMSGAYFRIDADLMDNM